jgi:hypothetical protein
MLQYIALLLMMLVLLAIYSTIQLADVRRLLKKILERGQGLPAEHSTQKSTSAAELREAG